MDALGTYVDLVWMKKDEMNLTSVLSKEEIWGRHIADGLFCAGIVKKLGGAEKSIIDLGAGAGYIGLSLAAALPEAKITLLESLQKRCAFMQWAALKMGLKNVTILNKRAVKGERGDFDFATERAMGKLEDIKSICLSYVKPGGIFLPFQSGTAEAGVTAEAYTLPYDGKERFLAVIENGHS